MTYFDSDNACEVALLAWQLLISTPGNLYPQRGSLLEWHTGDQMKRFGLRSLFLLTGALLLGCAPVFADSISVSNSNDGFGSSYKLTGLCSGNLCDVTLSIDTTKAEYSDISNVAFKIGSEDALTGTLTAPTDGWTTYLSSLNSNGCGGKNSDGQICSAATGDFADTGGMLTWAWTGVQVAGGLSIGHVGYKYETSDIMGNGLIVSDDYPRKIAEPHTLSLLAIGFLALLVCRKLA